MGPMGVSSLRPIPEMSGVKEHQKNVTCVCGVGANLFGDIVADICRTGGSH